MGRGKIRVALIFGGRSAEHEVSLRSALNVYQAMDRKRFDVALVGIDQSGGWHAVDGQKFLACAGRVDAIKRSSMSGMLAALPAEIKYAARTPQLAARQAGARFDVAFPILHGPYGEDGTIQGFLKLAGIPFVGAGVLGSAVGMDKDVMKRLLRDAGVGIAKFLTFGVAEQKNILFKDVKRALGMPCFVKPANMGSSVGITRATNAKTLKAAVVQAFKYDTKIVIEEAVSGREIECSVLGNENPKASIPGEIVPASRHGFYSYDAKYQDESGARLVIPAVLSRTMVKRVQALAIKTFKVLCCEGFGRVDMFLKQNGELLVNEINTIPGFTNISMYPKLWEASGISYSKLITMLIELALQRARVEGKLKISR